MVEVYPIDEFVDEAYFEMLSEQIDIVDKKEENLMLMFVETKL